jgi:hypothetical protein
MTIRDCHRYLILREVDVLDYAFTFSLTTSRACGHESPCIVHTHKLAALLICFLHNIILRYLMHLRI